MIRIFFLVLILFIPALVGAQEYQSLAGFGSFNLGAGTFSEYFGNLFRIALLVGSVIAVLMIAAAGIQYMTTDAVTGKAESKKHIYNAIIGLLMLLGVWLVFNEINPDILDLNLNLPQTQTTSGAGGGS